MDPSARPRVKVCCIKSAAEAWMAIDAGAAALGLVSQMPSGPGVITDEEVAEIAAALPPGVDSFLLTPAQDVEAIAAQQRAAGRTRCSWWTHCRRAPTPGCGRRCRA